ncbi:hypothetical protein JTB14_033075 [Gonioctena quinquepunctata]|nr:hypothetical protein JTB14_033075 [Gonioctena quinquepunctata]
MASNIIYYYNNPKDFAKLERLFSEGDYDVTGDPIGEDINTDTSEHCDVDGSSTSDDETGDEMEAFLGLLYRVVLYKGGPLNLDDVWDINGTGVELFRLAMSLVRFRFLDRCIGKVW